MSESGPQMNRNLGGLLKREASEILASRQSDRPWQLPFTIALAASLPMAIGAMMGQMAQAALASIGAMTIVYLPRTRLDLRMASLMAVSCAMIACYVLGQASQMVPAMRVPMIVLVALLVSMGCRYYRIGPPGPLFFTMAAAIGAYAPTAVAEIPHHIGIFALGSLSAVSIAFVYSIHILRRREPLPPEQPPEDILGDVVTTSVILAAFVGLSLAAAEALSFDKPYWVPVSCIAVMQGVNLRTVWNRQVQRIIGTVAGLVIAWFQFSYATSPWHFVLAIFVLTFMVETIIVRNYALATIFITPLAISLAEASITGLNSPTPLIIARLADTVLGAVLGMIGGVFIHNAAFRKILRRNLARLGPRR